MNIKKYIKIYSIFSNYDMKIIPAIDLLDGKCVRLLKGNYQDVSEYNTSPLDQINIFLDAGFDYVHIVDLDAAKSGKNKKSQS